MNKKLLLVFVILSVFSISFVLSLNPSSINQDWEKNINPLFPYEINEDYQEVLFEEEELSPEDDMPIIIEFKELPMIDKKLEKEALKDYKEEMKKDHKDLLYDWYKPWTWSKKHTIDNEYFFLMNGISTTIKRKDLDNVKNLPNVKNVWEDQILTIQLQDSVPLINADDVWLEQNATGVDLTGEGIIVAIIDTGVDYTHPDLGNCTEAEFLAGTCERIPYGWDFYNDDNNPFDDNGHGTHCAGIVGANGEIKGVAPNVTLLAYKVCNSGGSCSGSDIISAIENATLYGADVISMSLGGVGYVDNVFNTVIDNAVANGTVVVISAGNNGIGEYSIGAPGTTQGALTVGSSDKSDVMASFSSKGYTLFSNGSLAGIKPDLVAPGVNINSTVPSGVCTHCTTSGYKEISGTSMAAPHISGVVALLKQKYPTLTVKQFKSLVSNPAIDIGETVKIQGSGRVDALKSLNQNYTVTPNNLFFGTFEGNETDTRTVIKELNITNIGNRQINYTIEINISNNNITINLSNYFMVLAGNESALFNATIYINNSLVSNGDFSGNITITSNESQVSAIPLAVWVLHNPDDCIEDNTYVNSDLTLNNTFCDIPDFDKNGVLIINSSNVILDCNNSVIRGALVNSILSVGFVNTPGIWGSSGVHNSKNIIGTVDAYDNITIKNCNISQYRNGIFMVGGENHTVKNNNLNNSGFNIRFYAGENHVISNNIVVNCWGYPGFNCNGIYLGGFGTKYSNVSGNIVSDNNAGIYLTGGSPDNNYIFNNTFSSNTFDIRLSQAENNLIENNNMSDSSSKYGVQFQFDSKNNIVRNENISADWWCITARYDSINNTIQDSALTDCGGGTPLGEDIWLRDDSKLIFLNTTYNSSSIYFSDGTGDITRKWYLTVNTTDENFNPLENVNVSAYENTTGSLILDWSQLTDSNGLVSNYPSTQYFENSTGKIYPTLNISAEKVLYYGNSTLIYNLSTNTQIDLTLQSGSPDVEVPVVTLSSPENNSITNLTEVIFECNTTDDVQLENVSIYGNWTGAWHLNQTINISGITNSTQFNVTDFANGSYEWNCLAFDNSSNFNWGDFNWTFEVDTSYVPPLGIPVVTIFSPANDYYFNTTAVTLNFTVIDETDGNLTCWRNLDENILSLMNQNIILQIADVENLDDSYVNSGARDFNEGLNIGLPIRSEAGWTSTNSNLRSYIKFNISGYDGPVTSSSLNLFMITAPTASRNIEFYHVYSNVSWDEGTITWNNQPCGSNLITLLFDNESSCNISSNATLITGTSGNIWKEIDVTEYVNSSFSDDSVSFAFKDSEENSTDPGGYTTVFRSKEWSTLSQRPILNITYSVLVINGTYEIYNITSLSEGQHNISVICQDSISQNGTSDAHTFYIDLTNPIMNNPTPANGDIVTGDSDETFMIDVSDNILINTSTGRFFWRYPSGGFFQEDVMVCSTSLCSINLDMSGLGEGELLEFYFEIEDMAGNLGNNGTDINPLVVTKAETTPPTWTGNQTNTTEVGYAVEFAILYDDGIALGPNGTYIFSTNNTGPWVNESAVNWTSTPEWANVSSILNDTIGLVIGYRWYANDSVGNVNNTGIFELVTVEKDTTPPNWTIIPANASLNYSVYWEGVWFDATDTNFDTYKINDTRFTINSTGYLLNASDMAYGNYLLNVSVNDTSNNMNYTLYHIQINQSLDSCQVYFNESSPLSVSEPFIVWTNCSSAYTLTRNGTIIANNSQQLLGVGAYNFTVQRTDGVNYSNIYGEEEFQISLAIASGSLAGTSSITYTTAGDVTGSESNLNDGDVVYSLYRGGVNVSNPDTVVLAAGVHNYIYNSTAGTNYSANASLDTFALTVNQNTTSCQVYFNESSPLSYLEPFVVWTNCSSAYTLTRNGTIIANNSVQVLGVGAYNFTVQRTDGVNYSNIYGEEEFHISQLVPSGSISGTTPISFGVAGDVTGTESNPNDGDVVYSLYREGVNVSNPDLSILAIGVYNYIYNSTAGVNYTASASLDTFILTVSQQIPIGIITGATPIVNGTAASVTGSETNIGDSDLVYLLYREGVSVANPDTSTLVTGIYNYIYNTTGGANYTSSASLAIFVLTISPSTDYTDFTLDMVQLLQAMIILSMSFVVMLSVRRLYLGEMTFGELFTFLTLSSLIFIIILFLAPVAVSFIADLIN